MWYLLISAGFIGFSNHAYKIRKIAEMSGRVKTEVIFHPKKKLDHVKATNKLEDLKKCDVIFILSPNHTHFQYLEYFSLDYSGYIYCEKPPTTSIEDLNKLSRLPLDHSKVFFNFQERFGNLRKILEKSLKDGSIGDPLSCSILSTQGLAFKENYAQSWRSDIKLHPHGVAETKAIHFIDLLSILFGNPKDYSYLPTNRSGNGTAADHCNFSLTFENNLTANLVMSYAAPLAFEFSLLGTNGLLEYRNNCISVRTPRDTFDDKGYFITPPIRIEAEETEKERTQRPLELSLEYFLSHVESNHKLPKELFEQSLDSNRFILDLKS